MPIMPFEGRREDPAAQITAIALSQIDAVRVASEALQNIAQLQSTAPLAAEMAIQALRDLREMLVSA